MAFRVLVLLVGTILVTAVAGCGAAARPGASDPEGMYQYHCARCHARAGEPQGPSLGGSKGPNLNKIGAEPGRDAEFIASFIRNPRKVRPDAHEMMPAFEDKMSEEEIQSLAAWLANKK